MELGFGPKYFLKCVSTDSVNNSILEKIDFGLNGPDRVTYIGKKQKQLPPKTNEQWGKNILLAIYFAIVK